MTGKLRSLQGLRGIAICLVVVFHLFPNKFTNGFVGVDMFFVLSGYLMTRILSKHIDGPAVITFYKKRFIRIIPLYYLTILLTIFGVLCFVIKAERRDFLIDLRWCLPLVSNMQPIFEHHTYWQQVSSIRYLTHLWSLCTELQYYLMAPAIHIIASYLWFPIRIAGYLSAIGLLSIFQILAPFEYSYCFLASRVWQFLVGSLAFELWKHVELEDQEDLMNTKKRATVTSIFPIWFSSCLVLVLAFPSIFDETITRLTMTFITALFCFLSGFLEKTIFTASPLVFIGNLSYVIYLVHWPVINFLRYIQQRDNTGLSIFESLLAIALIIAISLLAHYFVERNILQLDFSINLTVNFVILAMCYALIPLVKTEECLAMKTLSKDKIDEAMFNLKFNNVVTELSHLPCDVTWETANFPFNMSVVEYCAHKGHGTGIVLVIGNSLAIRAFPSIFHMLDGRYAELRLFARHGSAPLLNATSFTDAGLQLTKELRPQVLWIIQGMNEIVFHPKDSNYDFSSEHLDWVVARTMDQFKIYAKKIFVDLPFFVTWNQPAKLVARSLIYRKNLEDTVSVDLKTVAEQLDEQTQRLRGLNCSNCEFIDVQKALIGGRDKYYFFEEGTSKVLNYDGSHLTTTGFEVIRPLYREKIDEIWKITGNL